MRGGVIEIFEKWVIVGQQGYDVDPSIRGEVYSELVSTQAGVAQQKAALTLATRSWSINHNIVAEHAGEARRMIAQLMAHADSLKPVAASADDIKEMVDRIITSTGQPPAQKLEQLSNLRYQRLLSDTEFEQAKHKILGI